MQEDYWRPIQRYCPNCGQKVIGFKNGNNTVKMQCQRCGIVMVSSRKSRRTETIDITAPHGMVSYN